MPDPSHAAGVNAAPKSKISDKTGNGHVNHTADMPCDDAGRGAGFVRGFLAALEVERMMDSG